MTIQTVLLSREEFYDLVWSEPMRTVAGRFRLSDVGLRKICTKHRIPVPPRGYWRRLETGQSPPKIALPKLADAAKIRIQVKTEKVKMTSEEALPEAWKAAEEAAGPITVPATLERPHAATRAMKSALSGQKPDKYGAIHSTVADAFLARMAPSSKDRVLRIADAFAKACESRELELRPGKQDSRLAGQLRVVVEGEDFEFSIDERMRQESYRMTDEEIARRRRGGFVYTPTYQYEPTGELTIKIGPAYGSSLQHSWKDSRSRKVEDRLAEVILGMRKLAVWRVAEREKRRRKEEQLAREQQRRADLRARIEAERKAIEQLEADTRNWRRAEEIRAFVVARSKAVPTEERWTAWALQQAERIDPLRESPPSILDTPEGEYRELPLWGLYRYGEETESDTEHE